MKFGTFLFFFFFVVYSFSAKGRIPKNRPNRRIQEEIIKGKSSRMNEVNIIKGIALPKQKSKINKKCTKNSWNLSFRKNIFLFVLPSSCTFLYMFLLWKVVSQFFLFSVHYALCLQLLLFLHELRPPTNIYNNEIICHLNRKIENQFSTFHKSVMVWVCCPTFLYNQSSIGWTAKEIDYEPPWTSKGGWKNILKVNFSLF